MRDSLTKAFLPKVQVKVIGSDNPQFLSGETDLRGVFVADGVQGIVTAVVRRATNQYAFYRGTNYLGQPPKVPAFPAQEQSANQAPAKSSTGKADQSLDANLKMQNSANTIRQIDRLKQRYDQPAGKPKGAAAGGFR